MDKDLDELKSELDALDNDELQEIFSYVDSLIMARETDAKNQLEQEE